MGIDKEIVRLFYQELRKEIILGDPYLNPQEQVRLQLHHEVMMNAKKYPPALAAKIYMHRRFLAIQAILAARHAIVFDAGCGYGSDSFLFASLGAKVLAVDISPEQLCIAEKRKSYFEKDVFKKKLDVTFRVADLNEYSPETHGISLTWIASVLAALPDQEDFLMRVYAATREGGKIIVTDMNLRNPWFLFGEWRRRQRAKVNSPEFARWADFWSMVRRRGRSGARFFPLGSQERFDDVQFFTAATLGALLSQVGFRVVQPSFSGFVPPQIHAKLIETWETFMARVPILKNLGFFYNVTGIKQDANELIL
jgi:SAM-dependent methyltransferase